MGKTRKSKRKSNGSCAKQGGAFSAFEKRMVASLRKILGDDFPVHLLNRGERQQMHEVIQHVRAPRKSGNSMVSKAELKKVNQMYQRLWREENIPVNDKMVSLFDLNVYMTYMLILEVFVDCEQRKKELYEFPGQKYAYTYKELLKMYNKYNKYLFLRLISGMTDVSKKIFCLTLKKEGHHYSEYIPEVSAFFPIVKNISINGIRRSIYKVGLPANANIHMWATVGASLLGNHYAGSKKKLDVYIQEHALKRMEERLDAFGTLSRNYMLAITFPNLKSLEHYKGYLLIPIEPGGIRVGYLFCNVIEDMLVIRTFLFITHSATPEGDRLKEYTGLKRFDISYWKIDRMSTLFKIDEEHWPELLSLFAAVGIKDLQRLNIPWLDGEKASEDDEMESFVGYLKDLNVEFPEQDEVAEEPLIEDSPEEEIVEGHIEGSAAIKIYPSRFKMMSKSFQYVVSRYWYDLKRKPLVGILLLPFVLLYIIAMLIWPNLLRTYYTYQKGKLEELEN